ncbi:hypothetical protein BCR32DRAFT_280562 [Anaeromyces robustus]|uniref:Glycosyltransferase 2-like domain-containing protein n=1 Tax=Anaeromyces robustus TaxID=1754192 RepID=A0A1Y1X3H1_9FUNG|nr:hypothetical protein BCR32DRAFT_280562 [Anaeromyces robustus]|eukprot:ORX80357.1 hypothetical protein BCR32DRAFT_280562 [Anaeromyces robustus]
MEIAKGEFIGFMDVDDFVDEKFFENLYKNSKNQDVVVGYLADCISVSYHCAHNKEQVDYDDNMIHKKKNRRKAYGFVYNSIWRKSFLSKKKIKFSIKRGILEDKLFRNECYRQKPRIFVVPNEGIYYYYERRIGSANPNNKNEWLRTIFEKGEKEKIINKYREDDPNDSLFKTLNITQTKN